MDSVDLSVGPLYRTHSFSSVQTYLESCQRKYAIERILPWRDTPATIRGKALHTCLERWAKVAFNRHVLDNIVEKTYREYKNTLGLEYAAFRRWFSHLEALAETWIPLQAEGKFSIKLPGAEWPFNGRIDLIVFVDDVGQVIVDLKTTGSLYHAPTDAEFATALQPRAYCLATGVQQVAFVYVAPEAGPKVLSYTYTDAQIEETRQFLGEVCAEIERKWAAGGAFRRQLPGKNYCGPRCPYWKLCWPTLDTPDAIEYTSEDSSSS